MFYLKTINFVFVSKYLNSSNIIPRLKILAVCESSNFIANHFSTNNSSHNEEVEDRDEKSKKGVVYGIREEKSSKAMRAYLERANAYNEFMKHESQEYNVGKRHLANMMGRDVETFTQKDIDEAIRYLLPSGLYDKKARPFLKPPEEVFPPKKEAEFDKTGRPYNFLFYTGKSRYYNTLHDLVRHIRELNAFEDVMIRKHLTPDPKLALSVTGSTWLKKEELETKFVEELSDAEYNQLLNTIERLIAHPYSYRIKDVVMEFRKPLSNPTQTFEPLKVELSPDGRQFVVMKNSKRKTALADVTLWSPGTGKITINGSDLTYFEDAQSREQKRHITGAKHDSFAKQAKELYRKDVELNQIHFECKIL